MFNTCRLYGFYSTGRQMIYPIEMESKISCYMTMASLQLHQPSHEKVLYPGHFPSSVLNFIHTVLLY